MTPKQIQQAITKLLGNAEIDTLQAVLIPHFTDGANLGAVEIKARVADTGEWFQGIVRLSELKGHQCSTQAT